MLIPCGGVWFLKKHGHVWGRKERDQCKKIYASALIIFLLN